MIASNTLQNADVCACMPHHNPAAQGTHTGPSDLLGVPPNDRRVLVKGVTTLTVTPQGQINKKVSHANGVSTLAQLGAVAEPQIPLLPF